MRQIDVPSVMVIEVRITNCTVFTEGALRQIMRSMFDIFTTHADGSLQLVESVNCLGKAQELANRLSCLFPGEYFGYFERTEDQSHPVSRREGGRSERLNVGVSSVAFLA